MSVGLKVKMKSRVSYRLIYSRCILGPWIFMLACWPCFRRLQSALSCLVTAVFLTIALGTERVPFIVEISFQHLRSGQFPASLGHSRVCRRQVKRCSEHLTTRGSGTVSFNIYLNIAQCTTLDNQKSNLCKTRFL